MVSTCRVAPRFSFQHLQEVIRGEQIQFFFFFFLTPPWEITTVLGCECEAAGDVWRQMHKYAVGIWGLVLKIGEERGKKGCSSVLSGRNWISSLQRPRHTNHQFVCVSVCVCVSVTVCICVCVWNTKKEPGGTDDKSNHRKLIIDSWC